MSKIYEQIKSDLKDAMRAKQEDVTGVLRMAIAAIRNKEISVRQGGEAELNDEDILQVLKTEVKKRNDSIDAYSGAGRTDLADKEMAEIKILEKYLPAQLSDEEIEKAVKEVIALAGEVKPNDFGKIMGQAMAKLKGQADGKKVGEAVKRVLG